MRLRHSVLLRSLLATLAVAAGGCVYRMDIQQGNFLKEEDIARVQPGMTRSQVRFLLGTPMIADSFRNDRWDYVHYTKEGRRQKVIQRHVMVWFDGDRVQRLERPDGGPSAAATQPRKRNWLKFWRRQQNEAQSADREPRKLPPQAEQLPPQTPQLPQPPGAPPQPPELPPQQPELPPQAPELAPQ